MSDHLVRLMLDSGAFSAWSRGIEISVQAYIKWIKAHQDYLYSYVTMDVIPGFPGQAQVSAKEGEDSAAGSFDNQQIMRDAGLSPIPVFHQGERFHWLEQYLKDESYIGIATNKASAIDGQIKWLDAVFSAITNKKGEPLVKTHGFGITRPSLMLRYPWFSTDSTTWTLTPSFGQLWIPLYKDEKPDYTVPPMQLVISDVERKQTSGRRYDTLGENTRAHVLKWLSYCDISLAEARYDPNKRRRAMLQWFGDFKKQHKRPIFADHTRSFLVPEIKGKIHPVKLWPGIEIMLATNTSRSWALMMNEYKARYRLLNYFELREKPSQDVIAYITKGTTGDPRANPVRPDWRTRYTSDRRLKLHDRLTFQRIGESNEEA